MMVATEMANSGNKKLKKMFSVNKIFRSRNLKLFLKKIINNIKRTPNINQRKWFKDDGDNTLRLSYELNENSVFIEVGGYKGFYTRKILNKFNPITFIFEPDGEYVEILKNEFNDNAKIINKALGDYDGEVYLIEKGDSSFIGDASNQFLNSKKVEMISYDTFVNNENLKKVDLISINIEGGEYKLLEHIIEKKHIKNIKHLQVQFHKNITGHKKLKKTLNTKLSKTHKLEWSYNYVWESWKLKI